MRPIFLIGYMAAGKTTFGRALARELGIRFVDLDFFIEQRFHSTVPRIFAEMGEERFRKMEANMLREVGEWEDVVVSCGGGTPCFFDNIDYINERGLSVLLEATPERILERVKLRPGSRPRFIGKEDAEIREIIAADLQKRAPYYSQAKVRFASDQLEDRRQIQESVAKFLEANRSLFQAG